MKRNSRSETCERGKRGLSWFQILAGTEGTVPVWKIDFRKTEELKGKGNGLTFSAQEAPLRTITSLERTE